VTGRVGLWNATILILLLKTDLCTSVRACIHKTNHKDEATILPILPVPRPANLHV
jgi:hypothetical protein